MSEKVEILLATYNGELYIREQLDSILNQDYQEWVVRACDDNSNDATYDILLEYQKKYPNKFLVERNQVGYGSAKLNFMHLLRKSTCDYVMCCDQDDIWLHNKISLTLQEMQRLENNQMPVLVHTDLKVVDAKKNVLSESFFAHSNFKKEFKLNDLLIQNFVTGCTMMMNRPLIQLLNRMEECEDVLMHDWMAAIVAVSLGTIGFVDVPTMLYRQHGVNSVGAKRYGLSLFVEKIKNHSMKKSLIDTTVQAGRIACVYDGILCNDDCQLIYEYSRIWEKGKIRRIQFYLKHKILKNGLPRILCQLIIG